MATFVLLLTNPITILAIAFILVIGFMISPYEIQFEEKEEIDFDLDF